MLPKEVMGHYSQQSKLFSFSMESCHQELSSNVVVLFAVPDHQQKIIPCLMVNTDRFVESSPVFPDELEEEFAYIFSHVFNQETFGREFF